MAAVDTSTSTKIPEDLLTYVDLNQYDIIFLVCGAVTLAAIAIWAAHQFWVGRKVQQLWI
jgi:hypothetical protein